MSNDPATVRFCKGSSAIQECGIGHSASGASQIASSRNGIAVPLYFRKQMDERVAKLKTPEHCEIFARNALERGRPDLAKQAQKKAVELRAKKHGAASDAEQECLRAIYAYEEAPTKKNGRRTRANRTWQMIGRHGLLEAVERAVNRPTQTAGYKVLVEMGLQDFAFEAVILRYPEVFSKEAVEKSRERMSEWQDSET